MGYAKRAVAVVLHRGDHGVRRTVVRYAVGDGAAPDLVQRVAMRAGLRVLHRAQRHAAVGGVNAGRHHIFALEQLERELAGSHVAARQRLGHRHLIGHAGASGLHRVGVGEGERRVLRSALALNRQLAGAIVGHLEADRLGRRGIVGHAGHGTALRHLIGEHVGTRLAGLGLRVHRLVGRLVAGGNHVSCTAGGVGSRYGARTLLIACRGLVAIVGGGGLVALVGRLGGSVARIRGDLASVGNSLRSIGSLVGFLGRHCLISGLRGIRFSLVGICGGRLAVHAQGAVEVLQRELDGAEVHAAVRRVLGGGAFGHGSGRIVGGHLEGELALDGGRFKPGCRLQHLDAGQAHLHRIARGVRVLELQAIAKVRRCRKRAIAVIDDRHPERDRLRLRRDALASQAVGLLVSQVAHRPRDDPRVGGLVGVAVLHQVLKHLGGVVKAVERHGAIGRVLSRPQVVPARCILHREGELAGGKRTSREPLGRPHLSGGAARVISGGGIRVGEGNHCGARTGSRRVCAVHVRLNALRPAGNHGLDRKRGLLRVVLDRHRYRVLRRVVGVAGNLFAYRLDHLIGVRLAHVALTQHHVLLAQRGLHGLRAIGSCGHGDLGAF